MNTLIRLAIITLFVPLSLLAQNPQLTSLSPAKFNTQSEPTIMHLTINGKNMWPDYLTITMTIQVMHIHFKKGGRDEVIRGSGISSVSQSLDFNSTGWLNTPGPIEVYITIDEFSGRPAYRSNSVFLNVEATPTTAPVINNLSNSSFKTGEPKDKYYIRIYGKNFGENRSTYATVGGVNAPIGWSKLDEGVMDVWVPAAVYTNAGSYPVTVHTKYGVSNPVSLKIEAPAVLATPILKKPTTSVTVRPKTNIQTLSPKLILNDNNASRLNTEMIRGVRVTLTGIIADGSNSAALENYISGLENVFVVDNQLAIAEETGNINVTLKAIGVDNAATEKVKKQIQDKALEMKITVSVAQ